MPTQNRGLLTFYLSAVKTIKVFYTLLLGHLRSQVCTHCKKFCNLLICLSVRHSKIDIRDSYWKVESINCFCEFMFASSQSEFASRERRTHIFKACI